MAMEDDARNTTGRKKGGLRTMPFIFGEQSSLLNPAASIGKTCASRARGLL